MNKKRIVVTGMGLVSCFGSDVDTFYQKLLQGESGVKTLTSFPNEDMPTRFAADITGFDPAPYVEKKQIRRLDPYALYSIVAGKKALEDASLTEEALEKLNKKKAGALSGLEWEE